MRETGEWATVRHKNFRRKGQMIYIRNFPEECKEKDLWYALKKAGNIVDLFCPKRLDKSGKKFGFARFKVDEGEDFNLLIQKVNAVWFGSYKLRGFPAKFDRNKLPKSASFKALEVKNPLKVHSLLGEPKEQGITYAEVIASKPIAEKSPRNFFPTEEEKSWLKGNRVAKLKEDFKWEEYEGEIRSEVGGIFKLASMLI